MDISILLLSIIGHIVLQYQHLGTFCCMQAALFMLVVGSVMCPLILEKTVNHCSVQTF